MASLPDIASKYEEMLPKMYTYTELSKLNPYVDQTDEDILYHLCLGNKSHDLPKMFGDVKFVVMGGTPKRMEQFAYFIMHEIGFELPSGTILSNISKKSHRYAMFKVGPVISVSHGMGMPSIGILLHELIKLMYHAKVENPTFIRIGTCSGLATPPGTVVITEKVVNEKMESFYELPILGSQVKFSCSLTEELIGEFSLLAKSAAFPTIVGTTYCTDDFYEGSARTDGAICDYTVEESFDYCKSLRKNGVINVEMESMAFAALTNRAGIKSVVVTVILCDRLETNQMEQSKEVLREWQTRPNKLIAQYIMSKLNITSGSFTIGPSQVTSSIKPTLCAPCNAPSKSVGNDPNVQPKLTTPKARSCVPASCPKAWSDSSRSGTPFTSSSSPNASEFGGTWRDCYRKCGTTQETSTSGQQKSTECPFACKTSNTSSNSGCVPGLSTFSTDVPKISDCVPACVVLPTSNSHPKSPEIVTLSTHETAGSPYSKYNSRKFSDQGKLSHDCYKSCDLESKAKTANKKSSFTNDTDTTNEAARSKSGCPSECGSQSESVRGRTVSDEVNSKSIQSKKSECVNCTPIPRALSMKSESDEGLAATSRRSSTTPNKLDVESGATPTESSLSAQVDGKSSTIACSQKCTSERTSTSGTSFVDKFNQSEISDGCDQENCGVESEGSSMIQSTKLSARECYEKCSSRSFQSGGKMPLSSSFTKERQDEDRFNGSSPCCLQSEDQEPLSLGYCSEQHDYIKERQTQELKTTSASPVPPLGPGPVQSVLEDEVGPCCPPQTANQSTKIQVSVPEETGLCCANKKDSSNPPEASASSTDLDGAAKACQTPCDNTRSSEAASSDHEHGRRQTLSGPRKDTKASSTSKGLSEASCPWTLSCKERNENSVVVDSPETPESKTKRSFSSTTDPSSGRNARCSRTFPSCKLNDGSENSSTTPDTEGAKPASYSTSEVLKHKAGCPLQFSACQAKRDGVMDLPKTPPTSVSQKGSAVDTQSLHSSKKVDPLTKNTTLPEAVDRSGVCCPPTRQSKPPSTRPGAVAADRKPIVFTEDESEDLCIVCRNIQEKRRRADKSILFGAQPRIIKCPHKLKRLKKEFRDRRRDF